MGQRGYPPEFRRKVLDLVEAGRPIADVAKELGISAQSICTWRRQDRIDEGLLPGLTSHEHDKLVAARRRIAQLEIELAVTRRAAELLKKQAHPFDGSRPIQVMALKGCPSRYAAGCLAVSQPGYYAWRNRPPSVREIRHVWLTDVTRQVHPASRQAYGSRRVHAELTLGRGITVGTTPWSSRCAAPACRCHRPSEAPAGLRPETTAEDLVKRRFPRAGPDQLRVTDVTEHPTCEGKLYCAVVLDAYSRRVVGWSIDTTQPRPW